MGVVEPPMPAEAAAQPPGARPAQVWPRPSLDHAGGSGDDEAHEAMCDMVGEEGLDGSQAEAAASDLPIRACPCCSKTSEELCLALAPPHKARACRINMHAQQDPHHATWMCHFAPP